MNHKRFNLRELTPEGNLQTGNVPSAGEKGKFLFRVTLYFFINYFEYVKSLDIIQLSDDFVGVKHKTNVMEITHLPVNTDTLKTGVCIRNPPFRKDTSSSFSIFITIYP